MMNRCRCLFFGGIFIASILLMPICSSAKGDYNINQVNAMVANYRNNGYTCSIFIYRNGGRDVTCTKNITTSSTVYDANKDDYRTLTGYGNTTTGAYVDRIYFYGESPFLYLQNPPAGDISIGLNSQLDKYYPKPDFNQDDGWLVNAKDGKIFLNGQEQDHLFYELNVNKINLSRNGRNFASKKELADYLQDSDFLTKLGLSDKQKKNSLGYFLPKLTETEDKNFYYLTILSDKAVAEISSLNIKPEPEEIIRQYFAVYPTAVPVKTMGDFIFPEHKSTNLDDFTAKETGEFLIQEPMQVFFE